MLDLARIITLVLFAILLLSAPSFGLLSSQPKVVSVATLKDRIIQEAKGTANGVTANAEKKAVVMNLVKQLETKNRVKKLSMAPALDGNWNLSKLTQHYICMYPHFFLPLMILLLW